MECPHCGARVPRGAAACPECGSDGETGWAAEDELDYAAVDIPDAYDPDRWEEEATARAAAKGRRAVVIIAVVAAFLLGAGGLGLLALLRG